MLGSGSLSCIKQAGEGIVILHWGNCCMRFFFIVLGLLFTWFCQNSYAEEIPQIVVGIAPYKYFVERIAGKTVSVTVLVPSGANAHTYEPTPRQMVQIRQARVWFWLGESMERRALASVQAANPGLIVVNLRKGIDLLAGNSCVACCHDDALDLHLWLSPRLAKIQATTIAEGLMDAFPHHSALYSSNLQGLVKELDALDEELTALLRPLKNRCLMISHPSLAYFCRDYGLEQIAVEFEGKDPTARQLMETIKRGKKEQIHRVLIQRQFSSKGARRIAQEIGAEVVEVDPYAEDYAAMMRHIARCVTGEER